MFLYHHSTRLTVINENQALTNKHFTYLEPRLFFPFIITVISKSGQFYVLKLNYNKVCVLILSDLFMFKHRKTISILNVIIFSLKFRKQLLMRNQLKYML